MDDLKTILNFSPSFKCETQQKGPHFQGSFLGGKSRRRLLPF